MIASVIVLAGILIVIGVISIPLLNKVVKQIKKLKTKVDNMK